MSLTEVATTSRKVIRYGIYTVIFLIMGRIALGVAINVYNKLFPPPPPPPTVAFGKLPSIGFPQQQNLPKFEYTLQTPNGGLPAIPDQGKVYFMPKSGVHLLSYEDAKAKASALGFPVEPEKVSETVLRFKHKEKPSTLEMNISSGVFSISYNLSNDQSPLEKIPPAADAAAGSVKNYLNNVSDLMPPDIKDGPYKYQYLDIVNEKLTPVISQSEASLIKIGLFRKDFDKLPSVTMNPTDGNIWFLVSSTKNIVAGEYHYFPVDDAQVATYPMKKSAQAYKDLQDGKAYIANIGGNSDGKIVIRKVFMAFLDPGTPTDQFYQPVEVYEGDRDFVAYVPLVGSGFYGD